MHEQWERVPVEERSTPTLDAQPVVIAWGLMAAVLGMGFSLTTRLTEADQRGPIWVLTSLLIGVIVGYLVHSAERFWSNRRGVTLMDQRGQTVVPRHSVVYVLPAILAVPGLLWLGVVGALHTHSLLAAEAFLVSTVIVMWGLWRAWCSHQLNRALLLISSGESGPGQALLRSLASKRLAPVSVKEGASLNLANLALRLGDLSAALSYFERVRRPSRRAPALIGSALAHALLAKYGGAERRLRDITQLPRARDYQHQVDEVRLLIMLRRDGELAAFEFGERLSGGSSGDVFRGLMMVVIQRLEKDLQLWDWSDDGLADRLHASGLVDVIPELRELPEVHWSP